MKAKIKFNTIFRNKEGIVEGLLKTGDVIDITYNEEQGSYHNLKYGYFMISEIEVFE